jgi:hypothetical protein
MILTFSRGLHVLINGPELAGWIASGTGLTITSVNADASNIYVDGSISEANRVAIQARIASYVPNPNYVTVPTIPDTDISPDVARDSEVSSAVSTHAGAADPHAVYLTQSEGDARYTPIAQAHDRQHSITSGSDHTFPGGTTNFLRADGIFAAPAGGSSDFLAKLRQSSDVTNATVTLANLPGLVFTFAANSFYWIDFVALCTSAAATTGYTFAFDVSVAVTSVGLSFVHQLASAGTVTGGMSNADANRTGLSSGVPALNSLIPVMGSGFVLSGASGGTCQLQFAPEVAASATCRAGSMMRAMAVA